MKISVVIPTYRRPALLARCLAALKRQNFPLAEFDVFVVSDGPDKATADVVTKFSKLIVHYFFTHERRGPAAARNLGWLHASAPLIAFTDDDCIPDPGWLSSIWNAYQGENEIAFAGRVDVPLCRRPSDYARNLAALETADFVTANCACTKKALLETGGFDERFNLAWREDSDLHFNFIRRGVPVRRISARVLHPAHNAAWGISIREQKKGLYNALLYKKHPGLFRQLIKKHPSHAYYGMFALFTLAMAAVVYSFTLWATACMLGWIFLVLRFTLYRLKGTSATFAHRAEMLCTSAVIPFVALYWHYYGAVKFRILYL